MNELFNELEGAGQGPSRPEVQALAGGPREDQPAVDPPAQNEPAGRSLGAGALLPPASHAEQTQHVAPPAQYPMVLPQQPVDMGPVLAAIGTIQADVHRQMNELRAEVIRRSPKRPRSEVVEEEGSALRRALEVSGGAISKKWDPFFHLLKEHKAKDMAEAQRITELVLRGLVIAGTAAATKGQDKDRKCPYGDVSCWMEAIAAYAAQFACATESNLSVKAYEAASRIASEKADMQCARCGKSGHVISMCWGKDGPPGGGGGYKPYGDRRENVKRDFDHRDDRRGQDYDRRGR